MDRDKVYEVIDGERNHQDKIWGTVEDHPHEVGAWITIMRRHLRKAEEAWASDGGDRLAMASIRKVIAVGVACCEQHGVPPRIL